MRAGLPGPSDPRVSLTIAADVYEQTLKEENDSLRWQLDSYRNEVELLRKEQIRHSRGDEDQALGQTNGPDVHIQLLQQSLHGVQQVGPSPRHSGSTKEPQIHFNHPSVLKCPHCNSLFYLDIWTDVFDSFVRICPSATPQSAGQAEEQRGRARAGKGGASLPGGPDGRLAGQGMSSLLLWRPGQLRCSFE